MTKSSLDPTTTSSGKTEETY